VASALGEWLLKQKFDYAVFQQSTASDSVRFVGDMLFAYGSTALALGYGAGIVLLARMPAWQTVLRPLQNLGRMALTVYLLGTAMHAFLWIWFRPVVPAGAGGHDALRRPLLYAATAVLQLVVGPVQVRAG
jgi:hypothetical protein